VNKLEQFNSILDSNPHTIICVSETWLQAHFVDSAITFSKNFCCFRADRTDRRGGGVLIAIPRKLKSFQLSSASCESFEGIITCCMSKSRKFYIANIYRPPGPDCRFVEQLEAFLGCILNKPEPFLLVGDFNLPHIDWLSCTTIMSPDNINYQFLAFVVQNGLQQMVLSATRGDAILDLILASDPTLVSEVATLPPFGSSDHEMLKASLTIDAPLPIAPVLKRNFHQADYPNIISALENISWPDAFENCASVDDFCNFFTGVLLSLIEKFVPQTSIPQNVNRKSARIRNLEVKKRKAHARYKRSHSQQDYQIFRELDRKIKREMTEKRRDFEKSLLSSRNDKKFWNYVSSKFTCKSQIPPLKLDDGNIISDDTETANVFSNFFAKMYTVDDGRKPPNVQNTAAFTLSNISFTAADVYAELCSLPNKLSSGPDGLPPLFLKKIAFEISQPLATIFEVSFRLGQLPQLWLSATVTPVHKKGPKNRVNNYRPISLTCVPCKIMEAIVQNQIVKYLADNTLIAHEQHGFWQRRSTVTQLLTCLHNWCNSLDRGRSVDVIYLDFASAFTSVSHPKLIDVLEQIGFRPPLLTWIRAFLTDRKQSVRISSSFSVSEDVTSGVPQGTLLGPTLFSIYINDIPSTLKNSQIAIYADDCKVFFDFDSSTEPVPLQDDLEQIVLWSDSMQLQLASHKCSVLHIGRKNPRYNYSTGNTILAKTDSVKDLGVTITANLKPTDHCLQIVKRSSQRVACIHRFFTYRDPEFLFGLFKVFVRPILEYASVCWNPYFASDIHLVEQVQRRFTKRILPDKNLSYPDRLRLLHSLSLESRRKISDLAMVYKILHQLVDLPFDTFFQLATTSTRGHAYKLFKPRLQSSRIVGYNSFAHRVINSWNALPPTTAECQKLSSFITCLQQNI